MFQVINEHRKNTKLLQIIKINHEIITTKTTEMVINRQKRQNNNCVNLLVSPFCYSNSGCWFWY